MTAVTKPEKIMQQITCHYCLFGHTVRLKMVMRKQTNKQVNCKNRDCSVLYTKQILKLPTIFSKNTVVFSIVQFYIVF